ncbi:galactoside alpha-(1,2)-fucosyltransferase 1-like [Palaemon carinicauda]|uniref:galactoside alpha-(1,2)-fucosyltransferase 1-like n=1 Tax=Palaemon carinicauda TaxID=392227 RepID=UPI0035B5EDC1
MPAEQQYRSIQVVRGTPDDASQSSAGIRATIFTDVIHAGFMPPAILFPNPQPLLRPVGRPDLLVQSSRGGGGEGGHHTVNGWVGMPSVSSPLTTGGPADSPRGRRRFNVLLAMRQLSRKVEIYAIAAHGMGTVVGGVTALTMSVSEGNNLFSVCQSKSLYEKDGINPAIRHHSDNSRSKSCPTTFQFVGLTEGEDNDLGIRKPLPATAINPRIWHYTPGLKWENLQLPVITAEPTGRLGNVMGEYATLLGLGRTYSTTIRLHPKMELELKATFPNISIEPLPVGYDEVEWERVPALSVINYGTAEAAASGIMGPQLFTLTDYPFEIQLFNAFPEDIRREFTFSHDIQKKVRDFRKDNAHYLTRVTIGVHVRRTDYLKHMKVFKSLVPEHSYFKRATDYYREKYPDARFIVASDDMAYVKRAFGGYTDVLFAPGSAREVDMALLASCNASIITLGSFGFWCGYLTGGEVVYPDISATPDYPFMRSWYEFGQLKSFTPLPP